MKRNKKLITSIVSLSLAVGLISGCSSSSKDSSTSQSSSSNTSQETSSSQDDTKLAIVSQPQSVTIDNGSPVKMSVKVNNPSLVKSYQWYNGLWDEDDKEYIKAHPLVGTKAKTDTYDLPSYYGEPVDVQGFKCVITDIDGNVIESKWADVHVNPGKENLNQYMVGDYSLPLGKTFDLSTTPYGTGTITINETGDYFIFDNVMYTNEFMDSNFDGFGFRVVTFDENVEGFTFEFKGYNCFINTFWDENFVDGGAIFQVQAMTLKGKDSVPALFKGNGSVAFYGGSYGIYGNYVDLIQDIDMSFYRQPGRPTKGLTANTYTLCKGRALTADLASYVIDTINGATFEEGSRFLANLSDAPVYELSLNHLSGVHTMGDITVNGADIRINAILNTQRENDKNYSVQVTGFITEENIVINNSNIHFYVSGYNDDFATDPAYPSSVATCAISGANVSVANSNIFVEINGKYISEARGINSKNFNASSSYLNINIDAMTAGGICCYEIDPPEGADLTSTITCFNTNMDINLNSTEKGRITVYPYHDSGLYACNFNFSSTRESVIRINTKGDIPTISHKFAVTKETTVTPHEGYTGNRINYENATITSTTPFVHNEQSYGSASLWEVVYESLYENLGSGNYRFIDNLVITY